MLATRLRPFTTTIFSEMSELALATGSLNLGQGFPDTDGPDVVKQAFQTRRLDLVKGHVNSEERCTWPVRLKKPVDGFVQVG